MMLFEDGSETNYEKIEKMIENSTEIQHIILKEILTRNAETEYLRTFMKGSSDKSTFKRHVPVITYTGLKPYMQRIANGETCPLISSQPITNILISSGTSGEDPKMTPSIEEDLIRCSFFLNSFKAVLSKYMPHPTDCKIMHLLFVKETTFTASGLPARPIFTRYIMSSHFADRRWEIVCNFTSTTEVIMCPDIEQSMYCQLLAGLVQRRCVLAIGSTMASTLLQAITFFSHRWRQFCDDIRSGHLSASITDLACRTAMEKVLLGPDADLASEITAICSHESWKGILCKLWPSAKYVQAIITGSMAQYVPLLEFYTEGKLPIVSYLYGSSECQMGINLKPLCQPNEVAYTFLPNMGYFEFIPLGEKLVLKEDEDKVEKDKLVDLSDVKLGDYYEVVVTTFAGLYRYRVGDVLQVESFHNKTPRFRFICRKNIILNIDYENTNEERLHRSVVAATEKILRPNNIMLVDYTSFADPNTLPGHYVLFWEIKSFVFPKAQSFDLSVMETCCLIVEEELSDSYKRSRARQCIGPLEIRTVELGTFDLLMEAFIKNGGSISQYKTPRSIKAKFGLDLLSSRVCASFTSPKCPQ